jgi:hypothetical protein
MFQISASPAGCLHPRRQSHHGDATSFYQNEVNPVMSAALDNGLEVTALHNHFLWDSPKVMFMHIGGMGDEQALARGVGRVFEKLKDVIRAKPNPPTANIDPAKTSFDPEDIERTLGASGVLNNGVYKVVLGRTAKMGDHEVGKEMGINTWAAFAGSEQLAMVDGDFAMLEGEVQNVLKALRAANINIVAIHNHMLGESPRYVFLHYWGVGPVEELAKGLKAALGSKSREREATMRRIYMAMFASMCAITALAGRLLIKGLRAPPAGWRAASRARLALWAVEADTTAPTGRIETVRRIPLVRKKDVSLAMGSSKSNSSPMEKEDRAGGVSALQGWRQLRGTGQCSGGATSRSTIRRVASACHQIRRCAGSANQWHTLRVGSRASIGFPSTASNTSI